MNFAPFAGPWKLDTPSGAPYLRAIQPRVEWREDKVRMGMVLARKGPLGSARFHPRTRHRLEAYATLLSGVSSDLSKCFLRGVPRAHRYHATVLV
jgi:hypothetical protein